MDMNLQAVRGDSKPKVVLFQYDQEITFFLKNASEV